MVPSRIHFCCAMMGILDFFFFLNQEFFDSSRQFTYSYKFLGIVLYIMICREGHLISFILCFILFSSASFIWTVLVARTILEQERVKYLTYLLPVFVNITSLAHIHIHFLMSGLWLFLAIQWHVGVVATNWTADKASNIYYLPL